MTPVIYLVGSSRFKVHYITIQQLQTSEAPSLSLSPFSLSLSLCSLSLSLSPSPISLSLSLSASLNPYLTLHLSFHLLSTVSPEDSKEFQYVTRPEDNPPREGDDAIALLLAVPLPLLFFGAICFGIKTPGKAATWGRSLSHMG